jgi:hypothetical protein
MAKPDPATVAKMKAPRYWVEAEVSDCEFRALMNDCPVEPPLPCRRDQGFKLLVNGWMIAKKSSLRLVINPPAGLDRLDPDRARLSVRVTAEDMEVPVGARIESLLAEVVLDLDQDDSGTYPITLEQEFDVPTDFGQWSWTNSMPLDGDDRLREDANSFLVDLWNALQRRDIRGVVGMQGTHVREMSSALFMRRNDFEAGLTGNMDRLTGAAGAQLQALEPDGPRLSFFAGNRLVRAEDSRGMHAIRFRGFPAKGMLASVPVYFIRNEKKELIWVR